MSDDRKRTVAQAIVDACTHGSPEHVDTYPRLFDDLEDDRLSDALFKFWQKGIVDAEWDEEDEETDGS